MDQSGDALAALDFPAPHDWTVLREAIADLFPDHHPDEFNPS